MTPTAVESDLTSATSRPFFLMDDGATFSRRPDTKDVMQPIITKMFRLLLEPEPEYKPELTAFANASTVLHLLYMNKDGYWPMPYFATTEEKGIEVLWESGTRAVAVSIPARDLNGYLYSVEEGNDSVMEDDLNLLTHLQSILDRLAWVGGQ